MPLRKRMPRLNRDELIRLSVELMLEEIDREESEGFDYGFWEFEKEAIGNRQEKESDFGMLRVWFNREV